jgi:hypothetical protein
MYRLLKALLVLSIVVISLRPALSQLKEITPQVTPMPPSTYQFIKYSEIPVSEYTGIPQVSIPIYTIKEGDIEFPIQLTYHAAGNKVADEATWVGLGWNLDVGAITQIVNDKDDLADYEKILIDYYAGSIPNVRQEFPLPHYIQFWPAGGGPHITPSPGISQVTPIHGLIVYTGFWVPINGQYNGQTLSVFNALGTDYDVTDLEPDVFKGNFNGHYLEFIRDLKDPNDITAFKVLNKKN